MTVSLKSDHQEQLVLTVSDAGAGFAEASAENGLGTRLIDTMVKQLGGSIDRQTGPGGYRVSVTFPEVDS